MNLSIKCLVFYFLAFPFFTVSAASIKSPSNDVKIVAVRAHRLSEFERKLPGRTVATDSFTSLKKKVFVTFGVATATLSWGIFGAWLTNQPINSKNSMILITSGIGLTKGLLEVLSGDYDLVFIDQRLAKQSLKLRNKYLESEKNHDKLIKEGALFDQVQQIFQDIKAEAIELYPFSKDFKWDLIVVDDPKTINAFCYPGGVMAVYKGIIEKAKNEAALAAVIGHEIGHALARHAANQAVTMKPIENLLSFGEFALSISVGGFGLYETIYNVVGAIILKLPYSRKHEYEADKIGLALMARAGYDPKEAITLWTVSMNKESRPPAFLSTHPSPDNRGAALEAILPLVFDSYKRAPIKKDSKSLLQLSLPAKK